MFWYFLCTRYFHRPAWTATKPSASSC
jgi:hypothetical protein